MTWTIIVVMALGVLATLLVLSDASRRLVRQRRSGMNGTKLFIARHEVTSQVIRIVKHGLLFYGLGMWLFDFSAPFGWDWIDSRNAVMVAVCALMGMASVMEWRYTRMLRQRIRSDPAYADDDDEGPERRIDRPDYPPSIQT